MFCEKVNRKNENFGAKRVTERGVNSDIFREKCGENMQSLKKNNLQSAHN